MTNVDYVDYGTPILNLQSQQIAIMCTVGDMTEITITEDGQFDNALKWYFNSCKPIEDSNNPSRFY